MINMSVYGYHDASVALKHHGQYYIYEAERFFKKRYATLTRSVWKSEVVSHLIPTEEEFISFFNYIKDRHNLDTIDNFYYHDIYPMDMIEIRKIFNIKKYFCYDHHEAHAESVFRQCPFEECYILTYDGNGKNVNNTDSSFVFWSANKKGLKKIVDLQPWWQYSLGNPYITLTTPLSSIRKKKNFGLPNAGKLMGLCSYGNVREEWKQPVMNFFKNNLEEILEQLAKDINLPIDIYDSLSGQEELDFAATIQAVFEMRFFDIFDSLNIPPGSNICLAGGCALNIIVNQKLLEQGYKVFVPPNSGDCGLSLGPLAKSYNDKNIDVTYCGFPILDPDYTDENYKKEFVSNQRIAELLYTDKKIIGYIYGNSECGPRALGNRSILCYPDVPNLKDKLNAEIKFREWFRPFGAITKVENINKYFENGCESPYMNFCPTLRPEYRWPSIAHVDNTCRIQTINKNQHADLYEILTHIENLGGEGILLNTSFNIKGKPILTTLYDAYQTLSETKLHGFVYNNQFVMNEV